MDINEFVTVEVVPQLDHRLGRQMVHDSRSKLFPLFEPRAVIDRTKWVDKTIRVYDPTTNPNQCHGECTACANAMMLNSAGNRKTGEVLGMDYAHKAYSIATGLDPFPGTWPPTDTGSAGIYAAQAAQKLGKGGAYRHIFGGADQVVQSIQNGRGVSIGTWWTDNMFQPNSAGIIEPTGARAGGHQYYARRYEVKRDLVGIRCWWGGYRDVWIKRSHLNDLLMDQGDAHVQDRKL